MSLDPKAQRLKALAAYQLLKAKAEAVLGSAAVDRELLSVLAKAAVLAAQSSSQSLEVAVKASLLKAVTVTGKFFILLELLDTFFTVEEMLRSIRKLRTDDFRAVDLAIKGSLKPIDERFDVDELATLGVGKRSLDSARTSDERVSQFSKPALSSARSIDAASRQLAKERQDSSRASDLRTSEFGKDRGDSFAASDSLDRIVSYVRLFSDSVDATDGVSVTAITDDGEVMHLGKNVLDYALSSEIRSVDLVKPLYDSTISADLLTFSASKPISDQASATTLTRFDLAKRLEDSPSATERAIYQLSKLVVDYVGSSDDGSVRHFNKSLADFVGTSDAVSFATSIRKFESLSATEIADVIRIAANGVPAQIERLHVADVAGLLSRKFFFEQLEATDDFLHETNVDDDQTVTFRKNVPELLQTSELRSFSMQRTPITETISANDSGVLFWTDYCDSTYFSQSFVGNERTFT